MSSQLTKASFKRKPGASQKSKKQSGHGSLNCHSVEQPASLAHNDSSMSSLMQKIMSGANTAPSNGMANKRLSSRDANAQSNLVS